MMKAIASIAALLTLGAASPTNQLASEDRGNNWSFGWTNPVTGKTSTYHVIAERQDFFSAETQCAIQYHGHLAAPSTLEENEHLRLKLVERYGIDHWVWVGILKDDGKWRFINGETMGFSDWAPNQPDGDGDCGQMLGHRDWKWNDFPCSIELWFICEV